MIEPNRTRSAVCPECGGEVRICTPAGGDGSVDVFVRHRPKGGAKDIYLTCAASRQQVEPRRESAER